MAYATDVLREAVEEAALLANASASIDDLRAITNLALVALDAGTGELPDEECKVLHWSRWHRLGITTD